MKVIHNKLVRDNIPDIILNNNQAPTTKILNNEEYLHYLKLKLIEEANEANNTTSKEELTNEIADILEVIESLLNAADISYDNVMKAKDDKAKKNGKFDKRIFLESVDDNNE